MKILSFLLCFSIIVNCTDAMTITEEQESECIDTVFSLKQSKEVEVTGNQFKNLNQKYF